MARIPTYISAPNGVAATSNARIDPNTAAAPYKAAEQSTANLMNVLQGELGAWSKTIAQKQAEQEAAAKKNQKVQDDLYKAQSMALMTTKMQQIQQQVLSQADGVTDISKIGDEHFQRLADEILLNAPSDEAKLSLTKRLITTRASFNASLSNQGIKLNNQKNMDSIEGMLKQYEAAALRDPTTIPTIKTNTLDLFSSMSQLGIPEMQKQKIQEKFYNNLEFSGARGAIQQDPTQAAQVISSGALDHLGPDAIKQLQSLVNTRTSALTKEADAGISSQIDRLIAGLPMTETAQADVEKASKFGLGEKVSQFERLMRLSKDVSSLPAEKMEQAVNELAIQSAQGKLDTNPKDIKVLKEFLSNNAAALRKDPVLYAQVRGNIEELPPIDNLVNIDPKALEDRKLRAAQIRDLYLVDTPMLSSVEMDSAANMIKNADENVKAAAIANLRNFDRSSRIEVANRLNKSLPATSAALLAGVSDPETIRQIEAGAAAKKTSKAKLPVSDSVVSTLSEMFPGNSDMQSAFVSAAEAIAFQNGNTEVSMKDLERSTNMLTIDKSGLFTGNYSTIAPGSNMTKSEFVGFLDSNLKDTNKWLKYGTGVPVSDGSSPVDFNKLSPSDMEYVYDSDGMYNVKYKGAVVQDAASKPVRLDLQQLYKDLPR